MTYNILLTERFQKNYNRLNTLEKKAVKEKTEIFMRNPLHPSLRTHRIKGHPGKYEFSVNMDIRVIWEYRDNTVIMFLDIGHHDILKRY